MSAPSGNYVGEVRSCCTLKEIVSCVQSHQKLHHCAGETNGSADDKNVVLSQSS